MRPAPSGPLSRPLTGKRLIGCVYGGSSVFRDIPRYVALAEAGQLDLGILLGQRVRLAEVRGICTNGTLTGISGPGTPISTIVPPRRESAHA